MTAATAKRTKMVDLRQDNSNNIFSQQSTEAAQCQKDVKCWASLRAMVAIVVPCCGCRSFQDPATAIHDDSESVLGSVVTGTIFGYRKGKVTICMQEDPKGPPVMLLELAMPTFLLVKEMSSGLLRIAMECEKGKTLSEDEGRRPLCSEPVWTMFCNGRKVGFAVRRQCSESDRAVLKMMQSISMGAGVIPLQHDDHQATEEDDLMYMRATYERVVGSADSESYHMINPDGSPGQELSIFFLRA